MNEESLLIRKVLEGDQDSFEKIIDLYKGFIFAIILKFIKDYEEVENVAQEVFLQIYMSLPNYKEDNFKAWIGRIASNKAIDSLRRKRSKFREETMKEDFDMENILTIESKDEPLSSLIRREDKEELEKLLNSMPEIYKNTVRKFYFEEKSYIEIAAEDKVSVKTIESRLYRARNIIKEKWRERI